MQNVTKVKKLPLDAVVHVSEPGTVLCTQVGGSHYTDMVIQPAAYNLANKLGWAEGDAVSYISRWRKKGGLQDLRKAVQTLQLLIEYEESIGTE